VVPVEEVVPAEEVVRAEEEPAQKERVLFVIQRHPEGIRIVDIGNELGVDWRSLTRIARSLIDEGKIERIDTMYYPGEKAREEEL
jgi:DNA-binding IclR family transcriptional regulator